MDPEPKGRKERLALWLLKTLAPRFSVILVGDKIEVMSRDEAESFWQARVQEWTKPRVDDQSTFQCAVNEETGELV